MQSGTKRTSFWLNELAFIGPMLLAFVVVKLAPLVLSGVYALTDWNGISSAMSFIGLDNFVRLFSDSRYWTAMGFTLRFATISLAIANVLGFVLATLLVKPMKMRGLMRAAFYIPNTLGGLVLGFIWKFIFLSVFGYLATKTGFQILGLPWLSTPETSFWALVIVQVWVLTGYLMLLYIAGITQIPASNVEASMVDGANWWQTLIHVKLPMLMPTITRCLFISFLTCMRVYDINISLTAGNPFRTSESVTMDIYATAFTYSDMAYGCAKALIFVLIVVLISNVQSHLTSKHEEVL